MATPSVSLSLLAPAVPVGLGRAAAVRFSLRDLSEVSPAPRRASWDWGDGSTDSTELQRTRLVHAGMAHRYQAPGVYRVRVRVEGGPGGPASGLRYVTVRQERRDTAGCGWVAPATGPSVPFGFVLVVPTESAAGHLMLRYQTDAFEVVAARLDWVIAGQNGALHFGGSAQVTGRRGVHSFRADVTQPDSATWRQHHLALSLYAPGGSPGRDSPLHRVSGVVRPGRLDLAQ